jgi:hypothetical protein
MIAANVSLAAQILGAIKTLVGLRQDLAKGEASRRTAMAEKFMKVAACLEGAASEIRAGTYPAGRCHEMLTYAVELPPLVVHELSPSKAQEISDALQAAYRVETLHNDRHSLEGKDDLFKLDEAAGLLRALANLVRP